MVEVLCDGFADDDAGWRGLGVGKMAWDLMCRMQGMNTLREWVGLIWRIPKEHPSGAKAQKIPLALSARLKSCPFKTVP
jgi:hypothetical protein